MTSRDVNAYITEMQSAYEPQQSPSIMHMYMYYVSKPNIILPQTKAYSTVSRWCPTLVDNPRYVKYAIPLIVDNPLGSHHSGWPQIRGFPKIGSQNGD